MNFSSLVFYMYYITYDENISDDPKKMARLLISHRFQTGLHSRVKLDTRQLQYLKSEHINFQMNLTKNMEMQRCFKKGCLKIQYCALD